VLWHTLSRWHSWFTWGFLLTLGMIVTVPPRTSPPPSERVLTDMRRRLQSGEWEPNSALPTVAELAAHYEVGHGTVSRAIRQLAAEGLVHTVPKYGVFAGQGPE
jgi:GntR family transcriptional regulator